MNQRVMLKFRGQIIDAYIVRKYGFMGLYSFIDKYGESYLEWRPTWRSVKVKQ
jgi:predicted NAD/FAD-binding protein